MTGASAATNFAHSPSPETARFPDVHVVLLVGILAIATVVRVWGISFGLPNSEVRPDEMTMVQISLGLLFAGLDPRFFHWPSLEFYALAALYRIAFEIAHLRGLFPLKFDMFRDAMAHPGPYLLVPRAMSVVAGVLTVWLVYRVTRDLFDKSTALIAAFFIAIAYLHVRDSHFGVTDIPMTALAIAALFFVSRAFDDPDSLRRWAAAGAMAGATASTKYNGAVMVAVGLVAAAMGARKADPQGKHFVQRATTFLTATLLGFVVGTPFALLAYPAFIEGLRFDRQHLVTGHGVQLGYGWIYHLMFSLRYGLGVPLLIAGLAGLPILTAHSWRKAVLVCTFPVLYYLLLGRGTTVFVRYMIPIVPFLCITAAVAVMALTSRLAPRSRHARAWIAAGVACVVALPSIERVMAFDGLLTKTDTRVLAASWMDPRIAVPAWVCETPDGIVHPIWGRRPTFRACHFDAPQHQFVSDAGEVVTPEWIILATSPLSAYTTVPPELLRILEASYTTVTAFSATQGAERADAFDQQDKFFVPYVEFDARVRPGPEIQIYHRLSKAP